MNNEQVTADALSTQAENELICEKLLGWHRPPAPPPGCYNTIDWSESRTTPAFTTWAEAGLIIDRFEELAPVERVDSVSYSSCAERQMVDLAKLLRVGRLRPADVRAAALEYIKAVKS
jgi:hypothetical protein